MASRPRDYQLLCEAFDGLPGIGAQAAERRHDQRHPARHLPVLQAVHQRDELIHDEDGHGCQRAELPDERHHEVGHVHAAREDVRRELVVLHAPVVVGPCARGAGQQGFVGEGGS